MIHPRSSEMANYITKASGVNDKAYIPAPAADGRSSGGYTEL
jgi:hypothetical protein